MLARVLVVDDRAEHRQMMRGVLVDTGEYEFLEATNGRDAVAMVQQREFDLVLLDWQLPDLDGIDVLRQIRRRRPYVGVVIITGFAEKDLARMAMDAGADDFWDKSPHFYEMLPLRVFKLLKDLRERAYYRREVEGKFRPENIIGQSPAVDGVFRVIAKVAPANATVLIQGESGTGKELVARAIHYRSPRASRPFIAVNCAAIPEGLLESELFGHVKGAFTGAVSDREGRFEQANEGTVFLDEIGDMGMPLQAKILRVLQERAFERVGGRKTIEIDVRVIAATNKDLQKEQSEGRFREDLFYRLNVVNIVLPPLRERGDDVLLLARHFIEKSNADIKKSIRGLTEAAAKMLRRYPFPGNVRQLNSIIERAIILADDKAELIDVDDSAARR
jgi:two-component system response regulator AtoC